VVHNRIRGISKPYYYLDEIITQTLVPHDNERDTNGQSDGKKKLERKKKGCKDWWWVGDTSWLLPVDNQSTCREENQREIDETRQRGQRSECGSGAEDERRGEEGRPARYLLLGLGAQTRRDETWIF
jgi:hypothetical protein